MNKTIIFKSDEQCQLAELLAALQYHGVKFSIGYHGSEYLITIQ